MSEIKYPFNIETLSTFGIGDSGLNDVPALNKFLSQNIKSIKNSIHALETNIYIPIHVLIAVQTKVETASLKIHTKFFTKYCLTTLALSLNI